MAHLNLKCTLIYHIHFLLKAINIGGTIPTTMNLLKIGGTLGSAAVTAQVPIVHMAAGQSKWSSCAKSNALVCPYRMSIIIYSLCYSNGCQVCVNNRKG